MPLCVFCLQLVHRLMQTDDGNATICAPVTLARLPFAVQLQSWLFALL